MICLDCAKPLAAPRKGRAPTGRCRSCAAKVKWTPELRKVAAEAARKRHQREADDPVALAIKIESGRRLQKRFPSSPEMLAKQEAGRRASSWIPDSHREMNRALKAKGFKVDDRKRIVLADVVDRERKRRAALTPFERQQEALARGAALVPAFKPRTTDPNYTLGGVSDLAA